MTLETKEMTRLSRCCCILNFKRGFSSINKPVVPWRATHKPFDALPFPLAFLHRWIWPPGSAQSCTRSGSHATQHMTQLHSATPSTPVSQNWNILKSIEFYWILWNSMESIEIYSKWFKDIEWICNERLTACFKLGFADCRHPQLHSLEGFLGRLQGSLGALGQALGVVLPAKLQSEASLTSAWHLHDICITSAQSWPYWQYPSTSHRFGQIPLDMFRDAARCFKMLQDCASSCMARAMFASEDKIRFSASCLRSLAPNNIKHPWQVHPSFDEDNTLHSP